MIGEYDLVLSGPISDARNYRAAFAVAANWARQRWPQRRIWNPALLPPDRDYRWYMRICCEVLLEAPQKSVVVMLPMWELSPGAVAERALARALGFNVVEMRENKEVSVER